MQQERPGLLVTLEAKPERQEQLAEFLSGGLQVVTREAGTTTWYAFRISENVFGIYDTFVDEASREAHLTGRVAEALGAIADEVLAQPPQIRPVDVLAVKAKA